MIVDLNKWQVDYLQEVARYHETTMKKTQSEFCSDNDAVEFYENAIKKSEEVRKLLRFCDQKG